MEDIFVDTDVILDVLFNRMPHYEHSAELFTMADSGELQLYTSALSFATLNYLLCKQYSPQLARKKLLTIKVIIKILPIDEKIIELALNSEFSDFEDAVQHFACIESGLPVLLSRNIRHYKHSQIPVMTPETWLQH